MRAIRLPRARLGGLRAIGFELGQFQIHAELLKAAIPRRQFVLEPLLCCFRGGLQRRDLSGQRIDGFGGSRVFLDHRFGGVAQFLDLGLKGGELRQKLGVRFHRFRRDQNYLGFGW